MTLMLALTLATVLIVSVFIPLVIRPLLKHLGVVDVPNERSSHTRPRLRGAGLAPLISILVGFGILLLSTIPSVDNGIFLVISGVSVAAGLLGWMEDSRGLSVAIRAALQLLIGASAAVALLSIAEIPGWLVPVLTLGIAGYINVANFMDGINGISGLHGLVAGGAYAAIGAITGHSWMISAGLIVAVAFAGFLPWNFIRGGIFLGDVGSYLLGGSIAIIGSVAVAMGVPVLAVLGPVAIYIADAGATFVRRVLRGDRWHEAHRTHVYQRLTDLGLPHLGVALLVAGFTILTVLAGLLSLSGRWGAFGLSTATIVVLAAVYLCLPRILMIFTKPVNRDQTSVSQRTADPSINDGVLS